MKRSRLALLLLIVGIMIGGLLAGTEPAKAKPQSTCPPCGMQLDKKDIHADVEGYRIYTCSTYCRDKVAADPNKYIQKLRENGEEPEKLDQGPAPTSMKKVMKQTVCPITGEPFKKDFYSDYQGKRIYFCCQGCVDKFDQNPKKYIDKMAAQGVIPELIPADETAAAPAAPAGKAGAGDRMPPPAKACPMHGDKVEKSGTEPHPGEKVEEGGKECHHGERVEEGGKECHHGEAGRHHGEEHGKMGAGCPMMARSEKSEQMKPGCPGHDQKAEGGKCCSCCCCCRKMKSGEGHQGNPPACPMKKKMEGGAESAAPKAEPQPAPAAPEKK